MRIIDVDPLFEGDNPQLAQLNQLLATAKEPWEVAQYKWRIQNLQNSIDLGKGAPTDATGNLKPVVDARTWMKQNPNIAKTLPSDAVPPEMQQPGMLDKIGNAVGSAANAVFNWADNQPNSRANLERDKQQNRNDAAGTNEGRRFGSSSYDPNYKHDQYDNEVEELEGLLSQPPAAYVDMMRRDFLAKKYGINGPQDLPKLQAIKNNELARIGTLQQSLIKTADEEDAKFDAEKERELALRAKYGHLAPPESQQQGLQESVELDRIKHLSKLLRG
jgi:hypothetical protein